MKQRITAEQLNKLSPEQQEKLREWWKPEKGDYFRWNNSVANYSGLVKEYRNNKVVDYEDPTIDDYIEYDEWDKGQCLPLLNIGQCIQIIKEQKRSFIIDIFVNSASLYDSHRDQEDDLSFSEDAELIVALWDAVKSIL